MQSSSYSADSLAYLEAIVLGNGGANYLLLTNQEVPDLAPEIAVRSGLPFKEPRIFWDRACFTLVIDFLERESVEEGDKVGLSLITRCFYDRPWRYEAALPENGLCATMEPYLVSYLPRSRSNTSWVTEVMARDGRKPCGKGYR